MAKRIIIEPNEWEKSENRLKYCRELEAGNIIFFEKTPFDFPRDEIEFLLSQKQGASKSRKNIAYKPDLDKITNHDTKDPTSAKRLLEILRNYSQSVSSFLTVLLNPYSAHWKLDYASFRPFQEKGRDLRLRARNDLLHVDSFPTRPLHGRRILRFFTNINPTESRKWITSEPFSELAQQFGGENVPFPDSPGFSKLDRLQKKMNGWLKNLGVNIPMRSPYDQFMLKMHNFLKESGSFQENCKKDYWDFTPGSCWVVFTDQVSHAAIGGQYALEQTLLIPTTALLYPERSPVAILERLSGKNMVDSELIQS